MKPIKSLLLALVVGVSPSSFSAVPTATYIGRADKIVGSLKLADETLIRQVRDVVAQQYQDLSEIHARRDADLKALKAEAPPDEASTNEKTAIIRNRAEAEQATLHYAYLAKLSVELTPAQVDAVKDGMTYGVLPLTFRTYQQMLPQLTAEQKNQILVWLTEAREHAMDASTSDEKHGWFGKYKGRITNYLAKAGYDLKAAEKNLRKEK